MESSWSREPRHKHSIPRHTPVANKTEFFNSDITVALQAFGNAKSEQKVWLTFKKSFLYLVVVYLVTPILLGLPRRTSLNLSRMKQVPTSNRIGIVPVSKNMNLSSSLKWLQQWEFQKPPPEVISRIRLQTKWKLLCTAKPAGSGLEFDLVVSSIWRLLVRCTIKLYGFLLLYYDSYSY